MDWGLAWLGIAVLVACVAVRSIVVNMDTVRDRRRRERDAEKAERARWQVGTGSVHASLADLVGSYDEARREAQRLSELYSRSAVWITSDDGARIARDDDPLRTAQAIGDAAMEFYRQGIISADDMRDQLRRAGVIGGILDGAVAPEPADAVKLAAPPPDDLHVSGCVPLGMFEGIDEEDGDGRPG